MSLRGLAALLLAGLLAACAAVPLAPRDAEPTDLVGRILVSYGGNALTANLRWEHAADEDRIWIMTPTGQTLAYIVDSPRGATLTQADKKEFRAGSVEALTQKALGWPLPLALLQYWVKGKAAPGSPATAVQRDERGRLATLTQNDWRVTLTYYTEGEYSGRVRRLELNDGPNEIRLVIDTWRNAS